jgi:toxin-antitoxin system PIN domain toxin
MILPDLNLLLYAYNPHVPHHERAAEWWEEAMNGGELVGLPNGILLGFVRIATHPRLGSARVSLEKACRVVETWLELPNARVLLPGAEHFRKTMELMELAMGSGALVSDASLAVHAMENRATLCTNDSDFARFPGLSWCNPLVGG